VIYGLLTDLLLASPSCSPRSTRLLSLAPRVFAARGVLFAFPQ
jgi:hypothetical protein